MVRQMIELEGKTYVVIEREEYERLRRLAKAADLPPLPEAGASGHVPAVAFARATLARGIIGDRARAGLTQAELAKRAGIRTETVCRIERGRHTPSVATIQRIDRALKKALATMEDLEVPEAPEDKDDVRAAMKARREKGEVPLSKVKARLGMK